MKSVTFFIIILVLLNCLPTSSYALRLYSHDQYQAARDKAITAARAGDHAGALLSLTRLLKLEPDNRGALYDYITVLIWDEQYSQALDLIGRLDLEQVPEYVLRSLVVAADRSGRADTVDILVKLYLQRYPLVPADTPEKIAGMSHKELALALADVGMTQTSLSVFQNMHEKAPHDQVVLADYLTALSRHGKSEQVVLLLPQVDLQVIPEFAFAPLLRSCKQQGKVELEQEIVTVFHQRFSQQIHVIAGRPLKKKPVPVPQLRMSAGVDHGTISKARDYLAHDQYDEAGELLMPLYLSGAKDKELLLFMAQLFSGRNQYLQVAYVYEQLLAQEPANTSFKRNRSLNLSYAGAPFQALALLPDAPPVLSEEEMAKVQVDRQAFVLRWSAYTPEPDVNPQDVLTDLLADIHTARSQLLVSQDSYNANRLQLDGLLVLQQQGRNQELLVQYEELQAAGQPVPDYVLSVVADAYLAQQQPGQAQELYLQLLEKDPHSLPLKQSLFYAYFDQGEYKKGKALLAELEATTPMWRKDHSGDIVKNNDEKLQVSILVANSSAYSGDLGAAQKQYEDMLEVAPYNAELHDNLATVYRWRGWPRKAYDEIMIGQTMAPDNLYLELNHVRTLMDLYRFPEAEEQLRLLQNKAPENKQVKVLAADWQQRQKRLFLLWVDKGKSDASSSNYGSSDFTVESYLYDRYYDHFRPFIHQYYTEADFDEGLGRYERFGIGGEYKKNCNVVAVELSGSYRSSGDVGLSVQTVHDVTDHLQFSFGYDSFSVNIPVRAYYHDITGHGYKAAALYRLHESTGFAFNYGYLDFSDGNDRQSVSLAMDQRVLNQPTFKITVIPSLYMSQNSETGGPYFNPEDDRSVGLSVRNEWLTCQFYNQSFTQILELNVGWYDQKHFGTNSTNAIVYQHKWVVDKSLSFGYGLRLAHNYYDGEKEKRESLFGSLSWSF